ncbi:replicative DNA helicase [Actinomadura xylanilytica]|uniref:replicative DNA helicase n=1 Tax=Actinomadura xylanilytica TaxID=887459 RepID=UPI00255AAE2B|nr:replicative DNA helicase [Actinomadura xylanilytica]MDL4773431.1 replicative DNA helicase [Actinomadura xylanilytica]
MSVTELGPHEQEFERTPPHDIAAEQGVLGGMLLSPDAIAEVIEGLGSADFYRPAHQIIYDVILDLYGRGDPADAVTVSGELTKNGEISRIGGAPYLHTLISSVPTAANAGYYAKIVHERSVLRRLVETGTRIVQMGYAADGADADDVLDRAQAEVFAIAEKRAGEDYVPLSEIMPGALDEIEAIGSRGGSMVGVPTGFADMDALTNGLHPGQMIVVAARPAMGKATALDTPLPTPAGWTTMGEVGVGDHLIGADGRPTRVVAATEVMRGRPCYEVEFSDGEVIVVDAQHEWRTTARAGGGAPAGEREHADRRANGWRTGARHRVTHRETALPGRIESFHPLRTRPGGLGTFGLGLKSGLSSPHGHATLELPARHAARHGRPAGAESRPAVRTTERIAASLRCEGDGRPNHAVEVAEPFDLPSADLPVDPYVLGARLGGGDGRGAHIPAAYLRASGAQRRALLAGLLDTGGLVDGTGRVRFAPSTRRLAEGVHELILTLGYRATMTAERPEGAGTAARHQVGFAPAETVFRTPGKAARQRAAAGTTRVVRAGAGVRHIVDVRPVESVPVRCVQVDNDDHMYLAGRSCVPTHNSTLALDFARAASIKHGLTSAFFSLEMGRNEITMRLLSAEARVALHAMRSGTMQDEDWTRLARRMSEVAEAPLFIDDSPNMSMMEIRAKCRRLKQQHDLRLVIIDYLQLMSSGKRVESRQVEVSEFSRSLKLLAKELRVPVIALSQLNRGPEQRTDKKPMVSDLRESGCLTRDTTLLRADTGAPVTLGSLLDGEARDVQVWSLDRNRRLVPRPVTNVFPSGVKETYRLRLASGREVKASGNHPFLKFDGWAPLDDLTPGDRIAIPRRTPEPLAAEIGWSEHRLGLLAHLIGDGCVLREQPVRYTSNEPANLDFVERAAAEFGIHPRRVRQNAWWHSYLPAPSRCARSRNPLHAWFGELGIENLRSHEKRIPDVLYGADRAELAVFLRHLWATDGCGAVSAGSAPKVSYATTSRTLADGVTHLLSRFGIIARIREVPKKGNRPSYHVTVADGPDLRIFCREIGVHGRRGESIPVLFAKVSGHLDNPNSGSLLRESWGAVKVERVRLGTSERRFQAATGTRYCGSTQHRVGISRARYPRCAEAFDSDALRHAGNDDVFWDTIVAIEPLGPQPVFDATVEETHNFVADGVLAHNSIEQDADMVILLHREDAYEKESPRAGEADLIVAKHRNGPTATVTVAFQGHYSRFVDMAQ